MVILLAIFLLLLQAVISWGVINLIVWILSLCFGFTFTFWIGTGVWLVCLILRWIFSAAKGD